MAQIGAQEPRRRVWQQGHGVRSQSGGSDQNLSPACWRSLQSLSFALGGVTTVTTLGQGGEAIYLFIYLFIYFYEFNCGLLSCPAADPTSWTFSENNSLRLMVESEQGKPVLSNFLSHKARVLQAPSKAGRLAATSSVCLPDIAGPEGLLWPS